jgi:3-oxoacyl-(acyl-carrier-protein) synthase
VGVFVGNILGGWEFAERELRHLWTSGIRSVSPYQATAWFPTAAQGNICIDLGIKGQSRTVVADRASGAFALIAAVQALQRGELDLVLAGGCEAPLSPYGWLCVQSSLTPAPTTATSGAGAYRPFQAGHAGTLYAEGAVFLALEREASAVARDARIHGLISGWARTFDAYQPYFTVEPTGAVFARAISAALDRAGLGAGDVGAVYAHGSGIPVEDVTESYAIRQVLGDVPVTVPKSLFGHMLGAAAVADVALACGGCRSALIPPTARHAGRAPGLAVDTVAELVEMPRNTHAVVLSRGLGGTNAAIVVSPSSDTSSPVRPATTTEEQT